MGVMPIVLWIPLEIPVKKIVLRAINRLSVLCVVNRLSLLRTVNRRRLLQGLRINVT